MTRFIQVDMPTEHPGLVRVTRGAENLVANVRAFDGTRGTATLLLAALVSALVVVANELVVTWTEGHLLAAWIAAWLVGFAALALFAAPMRNTARALRSGLQAWAVRRREAREDARLWAIAQTDARVMADLSRAMAADALRDSRAYD